MSRRRNVALLAVGAAAGLAAAIAVRRPVNRVVSHQGQAARTARLARLGARTGGSYAAHRARRVFADAERRRELDTTFEMKTAEQVTEVLGQMKGALMKLGQMASYLDQGLPEHVRDALAELQHDAPPMSAELAAAMIERGAGRRPRRWSSPSGTRGPSRRRPSARSTGP